MKIRTESTATLIAVGIAIALAPVWAKEPGIGSATESVSEEPALIKAVGETDAIKELSKGWQGQPITFSNVHEHVIGSWAWIQVSPQTKDGKQKFDPMDGVMHRKDGKWKLVEWVGDEVSHADDAPAAFKKWSTDFVKKHSGCPAKIFPSEF